jgi:CheY-like chemotaxis protein
MAKIMLVEDDNNLREIYGARLMAEGHEIVAAKDGEEALAMAVKEKPDLIISDVMMPRISGFDMLDILRNAPETKNTKVIMMTALSQAEDKARADSLGADRYLVKSQVTLEDVARVVRDVLEGNSGGSEAPQQPPVAEAAPTAPAETPAQEAAQPTQPAAAAPDPAAPKPVDSSDFDGVEPVEPPATINDPNNLSAAPVSEEPKPPAPEPAAPATPTVVQSPEVASNPKDLGTHEASAAANTPFVSSPTTPAPTPQTNATPITVTSVEDTAPTAPTPDPTSIKVEMPKPPEELAQAAVESLTQPKPAEPEATPPQEPVAETPKVEPKPQEPEAPFVGPSLTEALQDEADQNNPANTAASAATPQPEPNQPSIINGAPSLGVVTPTETTAPTAAPEPQTEAPAPNPVTDEEHQKKVIEPINDITKGPDLNALLEKEEQKAGVINPPANSVIEPATPQTTQPTPTVAEAPQTPKQDDEHSQIAL